MTYRYGRDWHGQLRKPMQEITEGRALDRWAGGPQFSVSKVPETGAVPEYTLVIAPEGAHVRTSRYDEHGSTVTVYDFADHDDPERLFLDQVSVYVYPDGKDRCLSQSQSKAHRTFNFRPNGWARSYFAVSGEPQARVQEFTGVDVSAHWVERPTFGDWDRFGIPREPELPGD